MSEIKYNENNAQNKSNSKVLVGGLIAAIVVAAFLGGYSLGNYDSSSISNEEIAEMILEMQADPKPQTQQATFFVGNADEGYVKLSGAQPFSAFQSIIDSKLG